MDHRVLKRPVARRLALVFLPLAAAAAIITFARVASSDSSLSTGIDVKMAAIDNIQEMGRSGTYPNGISGISFSTTSCNVGTLDVPWRAPMDVHHPGMTLSLYRDLDGRLEQVGVAWIKHGFFALSGSDCTPCQHHSDGTYLGVGCSDTYSAGNNGDRTYLGPRKEWNGYTVDWRCVGSYFSGGYPDCIRRVSGGGLDGIAHRLDVRDSDLANPGATYYYEGAYVVKDDVFIHDNWGYRRCTMSWNGSGWAFQTPSSPPNPTVEGYVVEGWGDERATVSPADDGLMILAAAAADLGGGLWHYEYALFNRNSNRAARALSVPVGVGTVVSNFGFHDSDLDPGTDWQVNLAGGVLTWSTSTWAQDSLANSVDFGLMYNFRFDANSPPGEGAPVAIGLFRPGSGADTLLAAVEVPAVATAVAGPPRSPDGGGTALAQNWPNPARLATTIPFELRRPGEARIDLYDAAGRLVRTLANGVFGPGRHLAVWDLKDSAGRPMSAGVYYYRLVAGGEVAARTLVVAR